MQENSGGNAWFFIPAASSQKIDPIGNPLCGVGSDIIKGEVSAYGERIVGLGSAYIQSNIRGYFCNPQYYFQVNDQYVKNKLKVILFPFLHKGHWMRTTELVGLEFSYKPPVYDINAPDLYIPMMAFVTYLLLAGFLLGINGKFSPEALGVQFSTGLLCGLLQVLLLEAILHSLGGGDIPLLDMVSYGGYTFVAASIIVLARIIWNYSFCVVTVWECFCLAVFLVKTMKRILIAEVRSFENNRTKRNYLLLLMAVSQIPLLFWLGSVGV
ncbi:unnamed protein product [Ilex paraguariensis]|uniref:Uncharacterized protein n=1 Tax=Ilex paraguariensis TaxID=185542 RepID=A0ABC8U3G9_9AQUA